MPCSGPRAMWQLLANVLAILIYALIQPGHRSVFESDVPQTNACASISQQQFQHQLVQTSMR